MKPERTVVVECQPYEMTSHSMADPATATHRATIANDHRMQP